MTYINTAFPKQLFSAHFRAAFWNLKHKKILLLSMLPFVCAISLWIAFLITAISHFDLFLQAFPNIWVSYAGGDSILARLSYYILLFFAGLCVLFCGVMVVGCCLTLIHAFFAPLIVSFVHATYYAHIQLNPPPFFESLRLCGALFVRTFLKFAFFSLCCYLLSFIGLGLIGLFCSVFVYFQFFTKNLNHDIGISIMSKEEYALFLQHNTIPLFFTNILLFIPLYIPFIHFFITPWQMLVLSHYMLAWYAEFCRDSDIEDAIIIELENHAP